MIFNIGTRQLQIVNYLKSRNGEWVKSKEIMDNVYGPHYNSLCGNCLYSQTSNLIKSGIIERRVCDTVNRFGRVAMVWYEFRYANPNNYSLRTDELIWEDGNPYDWIKIVKIDGKEVYRGKEW